MKSRYRKYNNGGPVKPKKKEKVYTDRGLYEKALKAYQDSLALNNYYQLQQEIEPESPVRTPEAFKAMGEAVMSGQRDTSDLYKLREFGDRVIQESDGSIRWADKKNVGYSPDLEYASSGNFLKDMFAFDEPIKGASRYWLGNAYNAIWPEPNVKPVYLREDGIKELPPVALKLKAPDREYAPAPRKEYNGMLVDPAFEESRQPEGMVELPPKLPFMNMDLTKVPPLRRVLPEFYGMRLNQQTGEYIYDTSEGEIRKKIGPENAQFVNMHRKAIERMRKNR